MPNEVFKNVFKKNETKDVPNTSTISMIAAATIPITTATATTAATNVTGLKSDEEIIRENLKELLEKKSREERKANGRLVAVIIAFLVIFLAVYHAWIRKTAALAGVIVPALIMLSYGGWVVILAKRDKRRKALFDKHIEEVAQRNKAQLLEKAKLKQSNKNDGIVELLKKNSTGKETILHFENEIKLKSEILQNQDDQIDVNLKNGKIGAGEQRKHRKHRNKQRYIGIDKPTNGDFGSSCSSSGSGSSCSSNSNKRFGSSHHATKDLRVKRPSIRQKLFRQIATVNLLQQQQQHEKQKHQEQEQNLIDVNSQIKKKRQKLQRLNALQVPMPVMRMSSAP